MLRVYKSLHFQQLLSDVASLELELHPQDPKIDDIANNMRVKIIRNGTIVFGGLIQRLDWAKPEGSPAGETYKVTAWDHGIYADWRVCVCDDGTEPVVYGPDHAGDLCKDLVYAHMGGGADASRRFSDLTIAADAHDGDSMTVNIGFIKLLTALKDTARGQVDWRFVPGATGCTFTTGAPFGLDRTMGNGVNAECVFSFDRRNIRSLRYAASVYNHRNDVYVLGQGEAADRTVKQVSDAGNITAWKRREAAIDARQMELEASLTARGTAELSYRAPAETAGVMPVTGTWLASSGTTWGLGDIVTVIDKSYRDFEMEAKIVGVDVTITPGALEQVRPILDLAEV